MVFSNFTSTFQVKEELQNMLEWAVVPEEVKDEAEIKIVRVVHGG